MSYSMTAFARVELEKDWGSAILEIRSVNQRYLETFFRLPDNLRNLETPLREKIRNRITRGKVECSLRFSTNEAQSDKLVLNEALAKSVLNSLNWLKIEAGQGDVNLVDVLQYPGVVLPQKQDMEEIHKDILIAFDSLLADFIAARSREGEKLDAVIQERLSGIEVEVEKVKELSPQVLQWQREKLQQRFDDLDAQIDPQRLEQEMVLLAQRLDVIEELDRLQMHVTEIKNIIKNGGPIGRRLDFMMQELNRESNTLASKSINTDITNSAVELKVLIEQMREQIQNIE